MHTQEAREDGVEGAHPQFGCYLGTYKGAYTLAHLASGLVGEGKSQDVARVVAAVEQVHNLVGEHTGLARPGSRYYEFRAPDILHGGTLCLIELAKI